MIIYFNRIPTKSILYLQTCINLNTGLLMMVNIGFNVYLKSEKLCLKIWYRLMIQHQHQQDIHITSTQNMMTYWKTIGNQSIKWPMNDLLLTNPQPTLKIWNLPKTYPKPTQTWTMPAQNLPPVCPQYAPKHQHKYNRIQKTTLHKKFTNPNDW